MTWEKVQLLERLVTLLEDSNESVWSPLSPKKVSDFIQGMISKLQNGEELEIDRLKLEFAPTSTIQEISMENGWSEEFLEMASRFDVLFT
jgi:hypothetical protein